VSVDIQSVVKKMYSPMSLKGKTVLVTGASSGIGRATALVCSELGARVVITGRSEEGLKETLHSLSRENHIMVLQDLTCKDGLEFFFSDIVEMAGKLHGLVHCAGVSGVIPLKVLNRGRLESIMETNFYSFVELVRQFGKKKYSFDGASVVGISAILTRVPRAYEMAYIASKAALEAVVPVMAMELKKRKIRVNSISPGVVRTEMVEKLMVELGNADELEKFAQRAIQGWQTPEETANVCAFLLSDSSSSINARNLQADGGIF